jgi:hypothetical protein
MNKQTIDLIKNNKIFLEKENYTYYKDLTSEQKDMLEIIFIFDSIKEKETKANPISFENLTFKELKSIESDVLATKETLERIYFKYGLFNDTFKRVSLKVWEHIITVESTKSNAVLQSFIAKNVNCSLEIFKYLPKHKLSLVNVSIKEFVLKNPTYNKLK